MAKSYLLEQPGVLEVTQETILPGQIANSQGFAVWDTGDFMRLRRFLVLGSEGGSYYARERDLTRENVESVQRALATDGLAVVQEVVRVSTEGRAPSNDPALFVLAMAAAHEDAAVRRAALDALPAVARIGTHLFTFAAYVQKFRGWGRGLRNAVGAWYEAQDADRLAYQMIKYRQRDGWTHRDLLRLAHPSGASAAHKGLYAFATESGDTVMIHRLVGGFLQAQAAKTPAQSAELIREFNLPREAVNTDHLNSVEVWDALLENMPATALIRNLGNMTKLGLLTATSDATKTVLDKLSNDEWLRKSKVHPFTVLVALKTYASGRGFKGSGSWAPVASIVDVLDEAFYGTFGNVEPTGQRMLVALDVSQSMTWSSIQGTNITPREASAAMALVNVATDPLVETVAFSRGLEPLPLSAKQRLDDVLAKINRMSSSGTNIALPMEYAIQNSREVDVFVVYTDNETNTYGARQPATALRDYRRKSGIDAKLVVVGMVSNGFTVADPNDGGMLDVVGFDTATPNIISGFARGEF